MPRVFVYGTFKQVPGEKVADAKLRGWREVGASIEQHRWSKVRGVVHRMTLPELARLDEDYGPAYQRIAVDTSHGIMWAYRLKGPA